MSGVEVLSAVSPWWRANADTLAAELREREEMIRRLQAEQGEILAEVESRGALALFGYGSTTNFVQDLLHVSRTEATQRIARARVLNPVQDAAGVTPALAPATAMAARDGAIGATHIDAITTTLAVLDKSVPPEDVVVAEKILVDLARETTPRAVMRAGKEIIDRLLPDGTAPTEQELAQPDRELYLHHRRDGRLAFKGIVDSETGASLQTLLSPLAKPRPNQNEGADFRSPAERLGDAFAEAIELALAMVDLPHEAGERPHVLVTVDYNTLRTGLGQAQLNLTGEITASQARRYACDATLIPAVLGSQSEPLDVGRIHRLVTTPQRRALVLRDNGCAFPGCERPPQHCQAHHIHHWANGGPTNLNNLVLLCGRHHRLIHHSDWQIHIRHEDRLPYFTPPRWLDPHRRPRHNQPHRT